LTVFAGGRKTQPALSPVPVKHGQSSGDIDIPVINGKVNVQMTKLTLSPQSCQGQIRECDRLVAIAAE
jgi:hypothetical protein